MAGAIAMHISRWRFRARPACRSIDSTAALPSCGLTTGLQGLQVQGLQTMSGARFLTLCKALWHIVRTA